MIAKVITTAILLLLAFYAFWGNALDAGRINPFGILLLFIAAVTWRKWEVIRDGFSTTRSESQPLVGLWGRAINGIQTTLRHGPQQRRSSSG
jgi:hypothetical protein